MENKLYTISSEIKNIKSHFGTDGVQIEIKKPITVIAGPNGEGKSNLIDAIMFGLGMYISKSTKLKKESSFFIPILLSSRPLIQTTFEEMIFTDIVKKGLHPKKSDIGFPERYQVDEMLSYNKRYGSITTIVQRVSERYSGIIGKSIVSLNKSGYSTSIEKNTLEHFDLIYLNSDNTLNDLFVKFIGQSYTEEINKIKGKRGQNEYFENILKYYPEEEDRIIQDVESGKFEEKFTEGRFISNSLPTGAKKECILYLLGILKEKHRTKKDWLSVIIVDELEAGLHINRKKKIIDALTSAIGNDEILRNHVKLVITTHSPVMYSELQKFPDLVDTYFVLREKGEPSTLYKQAQNNLNDGLVEKRILSELGLNVFELPNKILFVEGPTDKLFFEQIFRDVFIQPFHTSNINSVLKDFLSSFPMARTKEYIAVVDKNGLPQIEKGVAELRTNTNSKIAFKVDNIGVNSLEEFIFGIDISSSGNVSTLWNKIETTISEWNKQLVDEEKISIDFEKVRKNLEPKGRDGLRTFLERSIKKNLKVRHLYKFLGNTFRTNLTTENIELIKRLGKDLKLKLIKHEALQNL